MGEAKRVAGHRRLHAVEEALRGPDGVARVTATVVGMSAGGEVYGGLATATDLKTAGQRLFPNMPEGAAVATTACPTCGYAVAFTEGGRGGELVMRYPAGDSPCRRKDRVGDMPEALYCPDFNPAYLADFNRLLGGLTRRNRLRRT